MSDLPIYGSILGAAHQFISHAVVDVPDQASWVTWIVILILAAAATVDAFTEVVPDPLIFLGLFAVTAMQGYYVSWPFAAHHLTTAILAGLVVWSVNEAWYRFKKQDVLSMGDAKWTILAVSCFDVAPVLYAWIFALACGLLKAVLVRIIQKKVEVVYLAPFLFIGLMGSLYVLRSGLTDIK